MTMPDANIPKTPPDLPEILMACEPGASDELRQSILERLRDTEPLDEVAAGARDFLEAHGNDFDALRRFLNAPASRVRRRRGRRIAATVSMAAGVLLLLALGIRFGTERQRQRTMGGLLFPENGLPVFASLEGDRDFHDMMSAYRIGDVDEGLRLLKSLEARHSSPNDTLSYYGGWLHYLDKDFRKSAARFSNAAADTLSIFRDKARLMEAAALCLGNEREESRGLLEVLVRDPRFTLRREAESILTDGRLW